MEHFAAKATDETEKAELSKIKDLLNESSNRLLSKIGDYEVIVDKLVRFLDDVSEVITGKVYECYFSRFYRTHRDHGID